MSKRELIDAIRRLNRSVAPEFLARFGENELRAYFDRVCAVMHATSPPNLHAALDMKPQLVMS